MERKVEGSLQDQPPYTAHPAPLPPSSCPREPSLAGEPDRHGTNPSSVGQCLALSPSILPRALGMISFSPVRLLSSGRAQRRLIGDGDFVNTNLHPAHTRSAFLLTSQQHPSPACSFLPCHAHWSLSPLSLGPGHLSKLPPGRGAPQHTPALRPKCRALRLDRAPRALCHGTLTLAGAHHRPGPRFENPPPTFPLAPRLELDPEIPAEPAA